MNVLSLFDGMSCGQLALNKLGLTYTYYASEIKTSAIKVTKNNFPNTIHIGDVKLVSFKDGVLYTQFGEYNIGKVDLLLAGSPCQDFSSANPQGKGIKGDKSSLFYEFLRIKNECNPTYWLLENVRMKQHFKSQLDDYLGVSGVAINSSLVSYQMRPRVYWTNLKFDIPEDKNISFQDFLEINPNIELELQDTDRHRGWWNNGNGRSHAMSTCANVTHEKKIRCLTLRQNRAPNSGLVAYGKFCRLLTRGELEGAQNVPVGYTKVLSYNQACDVLGDGWTVDLIVAILKELKKV